MKFMVPNYDLAKIRREFKSLETTPITENEVDNIIARVRDSSSILPPETPEAMSASMSIGSTVKVAAVQVKFCVFGEDNSGDGGDSDGDGLDGGLEWLCGTGGVRDTVLKAIYYVAKVSRCLGRLWSLIVTLTHLMLCICRLQFWRAVI